MFTANVFPYQTEYQSFQRQLNSYGFLRIVNNTQEMMILSSSSSTVPLNVASYGNNHNMPDSSSKKQHQHVIIMKCFYVHDMIFVPILYVCI